MNKKVGYFIHKGVRKPFVTYFKLKGGRVRIHINPSEEGRSYGLKTQIFTVDEKDVVSYPDE